MLNTLGVPTYKYNCHSYAWYNQNQNNENYYWMNNPEGYYLDESYVESDGEKNDILCYYTNDYYYLDGTLIGYTITNAHSAIITSPDNVNFDVNDPSTLDEITVNSKWGALGLYSHKGDDCPYLSNSSGYVQIDNEIYFVISVFSHIKAYTPKTNASYTLSHSSSQISEIVTINSSNDNTNNYEMYELNIIDSGYFEFNIGSTSNLDVRLYDEHMQLMDILELDNDSNKVYFLESLNTDIYYLRVAYANEDNLGTISVQIKYMPDVDIGNNNVLSEYLDDYCDYVYINNNSAGFYKITLNAIKTSGTIVYPEGCIKVYADEAKQQLLARLETIFYTLTAETQGDSNNLIVFLEYGQPYYINIDLPSDTYSSMYINVERLTNTYDIIESNTAEEHVILDENTTAYGDYIQRVEIHEAGTYTITFTHEGP